MSKIPVNRATSVKTETEENVYKYHYGKFIKCGTLKQEQNGDKTNKSRTIKRP